jgi:hypothetical protein
MKGGMSEHAVTPALPDAAADEEFQPTPRERAGIAAFVLVAVVATAAWIVVLAWGIIQLVKHL